MSVISITFFFTFAIVHWPFPKKVWKLGYPWPPKYLCFKRYLPKLINTNGALLAVSAEKADALSPLDKGQTAAISPHGVDTQLWLVVRELWLSVWSRLQRATSRRNSTPLHSYTPVVSPKNPMEPGLMAAERLKWLRALSFRGRFMMRLGENYCGNVSVYF